MYKSCKSFFKTHHTFFIFILSIAASITALFVERLVGIDYDFHIHSKTYLVDSDAMMSKFFFNPWLAFFNSYYLIVVLLNKSVYLLIALNIFLYSLTNVILYKTFRDYSRTRLAYFLLIAYLLNPYRLHLSIHILKDTILIFLLVIPFVTSRYLILASNFISFRGLIYIPAYLNFKQSIYLIYIIFILIYYHFLGLTGPWEWINNNINSNFQFNAYDRVPNFAEYGLLGAILRAATWPFLFLSGGFFILSPSPLFLPLLIGQLCSQFFCFQLFRRPLISLGAFLVLAFFALMINGFTTYFRYAAPIMLILPMAMAFQFQKRRDAL
jgi:hypothetical protein